MYYLKNIPTLESWNLQKTNITRPQSGVLLSMKILVQIDISGTDRTDEYLDRLKDLNKFANLYPKGKKVYDQVQVIEKLKNHCRSCRSRKNGQLHSIQIGVRQEQNSSLSLRKYAGKRSAKSLRPSLA